jgi:hypothetical protein
MTITPSLLLAAEKGARFSAGYAFADYLEEGVGTSGLGAYLAASSTAPIGPGGELSYHRYSEEYQTLYDDYSYTLHSYVGMVGAHFNVTSESVDPFVHILFGARHDRSGDESNTALGGEVGGGVDVPAGSSVFVRVGADFQMFFDNGEELKVFRFTAGIAF